MSNEKDFDQHIDKLIHKYQDVISSNVVSKTSFFIISSKKVHGSRFIYSNTRYVNAYTQVKIKCRQHGFFSITPEWHLAGGICAKCREEESIKVRGENFITNANKIHDLRYDYSQVKYVNNNTPVKIGCSVHGFFMQTPNNHLNSNGCLKCSKVNGLVKIYSKYQEEKFDTEDISFLI